MKKNRDFTACTLYSGTGGSAWGLRSVGNDGKGNFVDKLAVDFNDHAQMSFQANFPEVKFVNTDIGQIDGRWIRQQCGLTKDNNLDFMTLSTPCQPWTMQNPRHGKYDPKMELMFQAPKLIGEALPLIAVTENVAGMNSPAVAQYFEKVKFGFSRIPYETKIVILDTALYGVPQRRQRLLFISVRHDVLGILRHFDPGNDSFVAPEDRTQLEAFQLRNQILGVKYYANQQFGERKVPATAIVPTITTSAIYFFRETGSELVKTEVTVSELKKLSSFPEDFILDGDESIPAQKKLMVDRVGNCVPPVFMERIARHLRDNFLIPYYKKLKEQEAHRTLAIRLPKAGA